MVLSIELEENVWVYAPGQTIKGKVVINKNIWNKVEGLSLRFYGRIEAGAIGPPLPSSQSLVAGSSSNLDSRGCIATARRFLNRRDIVNQVVLDHSISLLDNWKVLKPGRHEFDFNYTLPNNLGLPPSMKVKGAKIHYEFVTSLKRPRDDFKVYQTPFYICPSIEEYLHEDFEDFSSPVTHRSEKHLSQLFGCCMNGVFGMELKIEKKICSTGGSLSFIVSVWDQLRTNLDKVSVKLLRKFIYKKTVSYSTTESISEIFGPSLAAGENKIWNGFLQIPNNTPGTNFTNRDVFEINYFVEVSVCPISQPSKGVSIKLPLIILPVNAFTTLFPRSHAASAPIHSGGGDVGVDNLPPPTYDEATQSQSTFNEDESSTSHLMWSANTEEK